MDIEKIIRTLSRNQTPFLGEELPDDLLQGFVEGTLTEEERRRCVDLLSRHPEELAVLAVLAQEQDVSGEAAILSAEEVASLWKSIPVCTIHCGVAREGFKLLESERSGFHGTGELLSPPKCISGKLGLPLVWPADRAEFDVSFGDSVVSVTFGLVSGSIEGTVLVQRPPEPELKFEFDVYENETFLSSEQVIPGRSYRFEGMRSDAPCFLHFRGGVKGEIALHFEQVTFDMNDLLALATNLVSEGRFADAIGIFKERAHVGKDKDVFERLLDVLAGGTSILGELVPVTAGSSLRSGSPSEATSDSTRVLTEELLGRWSSQLPLISRSVEECREILNVLRQAKKDRALDGRVDLVCRVLEVWSRVDEKEREVEDVLFAMAAELKAIVDEQGDTSCTAEQEGEGISNGEI